MRQVAILFSIMGAVSLFLPLAQAGEMRGFYLANELPVMPENYREARDATLRICTAEACGSATIISNDGYLLTAQHVIALHGGQMELHPEVVGFENEAEARTVYVSPNSDFAVLKLDLKPGSKLAGRPMLCIPLGETEFEAGANVWSIGFPMPELNDEGDRCTPEHLSDGLRKFTGVGQIVHLLSEDNPLFEQAQVEVAIFDQDAGQYYFSRSSAAHGMSGGPAVDNHGDLIGITDKSMFDGDYTVLLRADAVYAEIARADQDGAKNYFGCRRVPSPAREESGARLTDSLEMSHTNRTPETLDKLQRKLLAGTGWLQEFYAGLGKENFAGWGHTWKALATRYRSEGLSVRLLSQIGVQRKILVEEDLYPGLEPADIGEALGRTLASIALDDLLSLPHLEDLTDVSRATLLNRLLYFLSKKCGAQLHFKTAQ